MQRSGHLIVLGQVAAEINRRLPDAAAFNEGNHGGVCCVYARVKCDDMGRARVFVIGTVDETWGASIYAEDESGEIIWDNPTGEVTTTIPSTSTDAVAVVDAILR